MRSASVTHALGVCRTKDRRAAPRLRRGRRPVQRRRRLARPRPRAAGPQRLRPGADPRLLVRRGQLDFRRGLVPDGLPAISLDTRFHVPRWDGTDGYQLGGDELVPWLEQRRAGGRRAASSTATGRSRSCAAAAAAACHARREVGAHRRPGASISARATRATWSRSTARGPTRLRASPIRPTRRARFAWLPELQIDPAGNALWFEYAPETLDGVDLTRALRATPPFAGAAVPQANPLRQRRAARARRRPRRRHAAGGHALVLPARPRLRRPQRPNVPGGHARPRVARAAGSVLERSATASRCAPTGSAAASSRSTSSPSSAPARPWSARSRSPTTRTPRARRCAQIDVDGLPARRRGRRPRSPSRRCG